MRTAVAVAAAAVSREEEKAVVVVVVVVVVADADVGRTELMTTWSTWRRRAWTESLEIMMMVDQMSSSLTKMDHQQRPSLPRHSCG